MLGALSKVKSQSTRKSYETLTERDNITSLLQMNNQKSAILQSVNRLSEIALNKKIGIDDQYFDFMIEREQYQQKSGYYERIKQIKQKKQQNQLLKNIIE